MGFIYLLFECVQSLSLFATLGGGFLSLLFLQLDKCRHTTIMTILVTTGLLHELYCVSVLSLLKQLAMLHLLNMESNGCKNLYFPSLLCNMIMMAVITWYIVDSNFKNGTKELFRMVFPLYVFFAFMVLKSLEPQTVEGHEASYSLSQERNMSVYFTLCRVDVWQSLTAFVAEYLLVYLPFLLIVLKACLLSSVINGPPITLNFSVTSSCSGSLSSCWRCKEMNFGITTSVQYFLLAIFVVRPIMMVYSCNHGGSFLDVIPSLINTVMYSFLCLEYCTSYKWMKHENSRLHS